MFGLPSAIRVPININREEAPGLGRQQSCLRWLERGQALAWFFRRCGEFRGTAHAGGDLRQDADAAIDRPDVLAQAGQRQGEGDRARDAPHAADQQRDRRAEAIGHAAGQQAAQRRAPMNDIV